MVTTIKKYSAFDGKEFPSYEEAIAHEAKLHEKAGKNYNTFLGTYNGKTLLKNHSLTQYGIWKVDGEDPNCDFGGHHHRPFLGYFEGILDNVIRRAVSLPGFWQWGSGGNITLCTPPKVEKV